MCFWSIKTFSPNMSNYIVSMLLYASTILWYLIYLISLVCKWPLTLVVELIVFFCYDYFWNWCHAACFISYGQFFNICILFFFEVLVIVFWIAIFAMKFLLFYLTLLLNKDGKCNLFMF
jgi:hypothetical protein